MIAGILLAAGRSRRFGSDKLVAKIDGVAVVRRSARALGPTDSLFVVVPPAADAIEQALARLDAAFVVNLARDQGMSSSIRAAIAALPADAEAAVIALGDQPLADPGVTRRLMARYREGQCDIVVPVYRDGQGNPVLFARSRFAELLALSGDTGARAVIADAGAQVATIDVDTMIPADVDTPEMLSQVIETLAMPRFADDPPQ